MCESYDEVGGNKNWDELEYLRGDHPSYTHIYKTIRRTCAEQRSIIDTRRDLKLLKRAFKQFLNLKELQLVFRGKQGSSWEKDYYRMCDMMEQDAYTHHVQLVLNALASAKSRGLPLQKIQLAGLTHHRYDPSPESLDWKSLKTLLTELVGLASVLRLFESDLALALLSRTNLNLRDLDLCSIYTKRAFVESFLQHNVKSLRSLKFDDVVVEGHDRRYSTHVTPADVVK